jgi:peptidoglycan/xylan/chitin deacetylase (PgdA/CDA1 family)/uncharacterized caspase-like protein
MMLRKVGVVAACLVVVVLLGLLLRTVRPTKYPSPETSRATPSLTASTTRSAVASGPTGPPADPILEHVDNIVTRYRKTIILLEDDESRATADREHASLVGKIIFQENHQTISELSDHLTSEIEAAGDFSRPLTGVNRFLDAIETQRELHDADKLSFREVLADVAETLSGIKTSAQAKLDLETRVASDRKALAEIQALYEKELDKIFGRFETRGMPVRREAWETYVAYLRTKYKREDILKAYESTAGRLGTVGKHGELHAGAHMENYGAQFKDKTFLLTFDDGPHPRYTDRILDILKKYRVKSVFFQLGSNLGVLDHNRIKSTRAASAARHVVESGFAVGSHGFSHTLLPTMSDIQVAMEIERTNRLLESVVKVRTALFRPPYGGRDLKVLAAIDAHKMTSVMWNVDSKDWADPVAKSIANRVIADARRSGHGIILLHDIHERTIEALPLIIETLSGEGYRFLSWNGEGFVDDMPLVTQTSAPELPQSLYHDSWAVLIGIDEYPKWPKLRYAVNDANGMKEILLRKFGFKPDHVITLLNGQATRERILSVLGDTLSNPKNVQRDDRVFVFFAGHGVTRKLPSGRDLGYIVPFDADSQNFQGQSISMTNFQDISEAIPAKHVLFVMDSCYSGLALTRGGGTSNYIREVSRRTARQMLTAGGANEEVADNGPNGHSIFSWMVLQGLEGRADLNADGFISAAELGSYVGPAVSALAHQTPVFGNLAGNEGGEFVFELHPETEFLTALSTQLDKEAIQLNAELDQIRKDVAAKTGRNQQLREQLAAAKSGLAKAGVPEAPKPVNTAAGHLNRGNTLYQEKRYPEALDEFLAAANMNPRSALAANNVGFLYFKLNKFDLAIQWTEKAIAIDPNRGVAYLNLADLLYQLNRMADARRGYERFLELEPASKEAPRARSRVADMASKRPA